MRLTGNLWICWGSDYPNRIGFEIYGGHHHPIGASLLLWARYVAIEWRAA